MTRMYGYRQGEDSASQSHLLLPYDMPYISSSVHGQVTQPPTSRSLNLANPAINPATRGINPATTPTGVVPFDLLNLQELMTPHKTFICPVCGKERPDKSIFRRHYTSHSGEKDFACPLCPYRSNQVSHLYRHTNIKHDLQFGRRASRP